ncbi:MAG: tail fiber domain-containing protein, partial [Patescibacteria group bacterium]|nr:tail fiber domain-containing protein [Patescibacteria group bacterium]
IPAITANDTICTNGSVCSNYAPVSGSGNYIQLQATTPGAAQTGNLNITGTGVIGTVTAGAGGISTTGAISQTGATTLSTGTGAVSLNGSTTVAANQNFTLASGTGSFGQTYSNTAAGTAQSLTVTNGNAGATATTVNGENISLVGTANGNANANTVNGINFANVAALANNSFNGLYFGTGYTSLLNYNGASIISGTGLLQSAGLNGTYSNALTFNNASNAFTGSGAGLTSLNGSNITSGSVGATVGGTGLTGYTTGDLLYANSATTLGKLSDVATGSCLISGGAGVAPTWGSCAAAGSISGSGTTNTIALFTAAGAIGNSILTQSGTTVTAAGTIAATTLQGAGSGITSLNGSNITSGSVGVTYGGTGVNGAAAANGSLLIGNGTGYTLATLTQGANIAISNAAGGITIATSATPSFTSVTATGANALTLGTSATNTGAVVFKGAGGAGTLTLQGPTTPNVGNFTLTIPTITANDTICTNGSVCSNYAPVSGSGNYVQLQATTPGSAQTGNLNLTGTAIAGTLTAGAGGISTTGAISQTGATSLSTGTGAVSLNGATTVAANQNLTLTSGTGVFGQTYSNTAAGTAQTLTVTNANASATATTVNGESIALVGTANGNANVNTLNAINLPAVTTLANNSFNVLNVSTGYNNILNYNGTSIINGTGILQSAGLSGTYSNALTLNSASNVFTGNGANLTSLNGSNISSGTVAASVGGTGVNGGAAANGALLIGNGTGYTLATLTQGSNIAITNAAGSITVATSANPSFTSISASAAASLTVGTSSVNTGSIVYRGSGGAGTLTLQGPTTPNAGNFTLSLPAITGNDTICTNGSVCSNYAPASGSGNYIQLQATTPGSAQTGNLNITGTGIVGTITGGAGGISTTGAFSQTGATTFSTGTGAISLNGDITVAAGKGLTVGTGATSLGGTVGVTGLLTASGGITLPANKNLTLSSGNGTINQTFQNSAAGSAQSLSVTNSNASATPTIINGQSIALVGTANGTANVNTVNGLNFNNVSALANNTFNGLYFGTGYNSLLNYNGTPLISGTGLLQTAAVSGSYTGITGVGTLTAGTWNGSTITVPYGGTGATTFTQNGVVYGNTAGALQVTAAGTTGQCLVGNTGAAPTFAACTTGTAVTTVGSFSASSQTNGANITGSTITFGPADTTNPGMVSTGTQTFAGSKTFTQSNGNTFSATSDLSTGARSADVAVISQANNVTNDSTGRLLYINNGDTGSNAAGIQIDNAAAAGTGLAIGGSGITSGTGIAVGSAIQGGTAINISQAAGITSGTGLAIGGGINTATAFTGNYLSVNPTRTLTGASINDSGSFLNLSRANTVNSAGNTFTVSGALANLASNCTQTAGTCSDTANILKLNQQYANASGAVFSLQGAGTGNLETLIASNASANGVSVQVASASASQYALSVSGNAGASSLLYVRADGNVGINNATPVSRLTVGGGTANNLGIIVQSSDVSLILTEDSSTNAGKIQVKSGGTSSTIGATNYRLALQPEGGTVSIGNTNGTYPLDVTGNVNTSGAYLTSGTTRLDASGNLSNIGTYNGSGNITTAGTLQATSTANSVFGNGTTGGIQIGDGSVTKTSGTGFIFNSSIQGSQLISTASTGTAPLVVSSTTQVPNLNVTYLGGFSEAQIAENLRSNINVSGGGTVSFNGTGVSWSSRFIVISNGNGSDFSTSGYFDITEPANGTVITGVGGAANATVAGGYIPLTAWQAVYYILPNGSSNASVNANFRVAAYTAGMTVPSNWVLIAIENGDNTTLKTAAGLTLRSGQTATAGTIDNPTFNTSVTTQTLTATNGGIFANGTNPTFSLNSNTISFASASSSGAFSTSAVANDLVIRNTNASGNIMLQQGAGAAQLYVQGSTGNVGIGTAAPGYKLDVQGNANFVSNLYGNGKDAIATGDTYLRLNQSFNFSSGVYTPGTFRADGNVSIGAGLSGRRLDVFTPTNNGDGLSIGQDTDNSQTIQAYIDGQWTNRATYASGCCNLLKLQPDVGDVKIGSSLQVAYSGAITGATTYNSQTITSAANFTGTLNVATSISVGGVAICTASGCTANGGNSATVTDGMYLSPTQTVTGVKYFQSNKGAGSTLGANSGYTLEAFSNDGGAAAMSFHRGGAYAVNFGLDPDNILRIGGWSAPANVWQLDMSGNETIAGGLTATAGTFSSNITAAGYIRAGGELQSTSSNALRMVYGSYGSILRNDGTDTYLLLTAAADQYGSWNGLRPLQINDSSGTVYLGGQQLTVQNGGNVGIGFTGPTAKLYVLNNVNTQTGLLVKAVASQAAGTYALDVQDSTGTIHLLSSTVTGITASGTMPLNTGGSANIITANVSDDAGGVLQGGNLFTTNVTSPTAADNAATFGNVLNTTTDVSKTIAFTGDLFGGIGQLMLNGTTSSTFSAYSYGLLGKIQQTVNTGTISNAIGVAGAFGLGNSTPVTNAINLYALGPQVGTSAGIQNAYGLYIKNVNYGSSSNYAIYSEGGQTFLGGTQGATSAGNGTQGGTVLTVAGATGGNTTGTTGQNAGNGGSISLTAGNGGNAPAGGNNGWGGNIFIQAGSNGSGAGTSGLDGSVLINGNGRGQLDVGGPYVFGGYGAVLHNNILSDGNLYFSQANIITPLTTATANGVGYALSISAGAANGATTGNNGGGVGINGGAAAGTGNNGGGGIILDGGTGTGTGGKGNILLQSGSGYGVVGLGTVSPVANLDINPTAAQAIRIEGSGTNRIAIVGSANNNIWNMDNAGGTFRLFREDYSAFGAGANGSVKLSITDAGGITLNGSITNSGITAGTGTVVCATAGNVLVKSNAVCANPSSIAYKENVVSLSDSLSILGQLRPVSFDWKTSSGYYAADRGRGDYGLIAQEVNNVLPQLVQHDDSGTIIGLNYLGFVPFVIGGIQQQQQQINAIQTMLATNLTTQNLTVTKLATFATLHVTGAVQIDGGLTVAGPTSVQDITVNGHVITAGTTPTFTALTAAGANATATVNGNDTSGTITLTTGVTPTVGDMATVTFNKAFGKTPRIIITPNDGKSAPLLIYPTQMSATSFNFALSNLPAGATTYSFNYFIVE